jgi:hypothetical protein
MFSVLEIYKFRTNSTTFKYGRRKKKGVVLFLT